MPEHPVFNDGLMARAILAAHSDVIVASDREWVIRFWSPGAERIIRPSAAEALGGPLQISLGEERTGVP